MGLGFAIKRMERCDFGWSYSGFNYFRDRLAKESGITLDDMDGFGGNVSWGPYVNLPLYSLIDHSDCDGRLTYEQCKLIAPALADAIRAWPDDDYDKATALLLIESMESMGECDTLEFC